MGRAACLVRNWPTSRIRGQTVLGARNYQPANLVRLLPAPTKAIAKIAATSSTEAWPGTAEHYGWTAALSQFGPGGGCSPPAPVRSRPAGPTPWLCSNVPRTLPRHSQATVLTVGTVGKLQL